MAGSFRAMSARLSIALAGTPLCRCGSLIGASGLAGLVVGTTPIAISSSGWCSASPWRPRSTIRPLPRSGRIFGAAARAPITTLTLAGGFASTVSWPATQFLIDTTGWRGAYLVYAAFWLSSLRRCMPSRCRAGARRIADERRRWLGRRPKPHPCWRRVAWPSCWSPRLCSYAFVPSALSAQLLAIFQRFGLAPATVVAIGMLFGPAQVLARICELGFARHVHPLWVARFRRRPSGRGVYFADAFTFSGSVAAALP